MAVEGRLDWRERRGRRRHREYVQIVANTVQFLGGKPKDRDGEGEEPEQAEGAGEEARDDIPF